MGASKLTILGLAVAMFGGLSPRATAAPLGLPLGSPAYVVVGGTATYSGGILTIIGTDVDANPDPLPAQFTVTIPVGSTGLLTSNSGTLSLSIDTDMNSSYETVVATSSYVAAFGFKEDGVGNGLLEATFLQSAPGTGSFSTGATIGLKFAPATALNPPDWASGYFSVEGKSDVALVAVPTPTAAFAGAGGLMAIVVARAVRRRSRVA